MAVQIGCSHTRLGRAQKTGENQLLPVITAGGASANTETIVLQHNCRYNVDKLNE